MMNRDAFSSFHPAVNFLFFGLVFGFSMFIMHPVMLGISFASALTYALYLDKKGTLSFCVKFLFPVMLAAAVINPAFSHKGMTVIRYLPSGNPLTLESILYGIAAAFMLAAVMLWFRCYTEIMTSDKFIYLFGKFIPSLSLVLSMTLRFIPKFKAQFETVRDAQRCLGRDTENGSIMSRLKNSIAVISIVITWSLENAIETADSMKSRGYGAKNRTSFSIYRFDGRDRAALIWLAFCGMLLISGIISKGLKWRYFPSVKGSMTHPLTICFFIVYAFLCITPFAIDLRNDIIRRSLKSGS